MLCHIESPYKHFLMILKFCISLTQLGLIKDVTIQLTRENVQIMEIVSMAFAFVRLVTQVNFFFN